VTSRIGEAFSGAGRPLLVACLVAGDPSEEVSLELMREAESCGADIIELVMPHSDPVADGPVMQKAMQRALHAGTTPGTLFTLVREFRARSGTPVLVLTYANIVVQRGISRSTGMQRLPVQTGSRSPTRPSRRQTPSAERLANRGSTRSSSSARRLLGNGSRRLQPKPAGSSTSSRCSA